MALATVVGVHRLRRDITVVRLVGEHIAFAPGQSLSVTVPSHPTLPRRYSSAMLPSLDGKYEFHVRAVPGGWVSGSIVADTAVGDQWVLGDPAGDLAVDDSGRDVVMIAGGTGLAPMVSLILDLARRPEPPRVYLVTGGRSPRDLYASDMLLTLEQSTPWLTTVPVVDTLTDPDDPDPWFARAELERMSAAPNSAFAADEFEVGRIATVAAGWGPYTDQQVLVCGSPAMTSATVAELVATGTPREAIRT